MGPGEALSFLGLCAFGIALLAMAFAVYSKRLTFKQRQLELQSQTGAGSSADSGRIAKLEQRVRVLERIATDRGQDVAHQIEALRDRHEAEGEADSGVPLGTARKEAV